MSPLDDHGRAQLDAYASTVQPAAENRRLNHARLLERIATSDDPPEATVPLGSTPPAVRWPLVALAAAVLVTVALGWALRDASETRIPERATQAESTIAPSEPRPSVLRTPPPPTRSAPAPEPKPAPHVPPATAEQPHRGTKPPRGPTKVVPKPVPAGTPMPSKTSSRLAAEVVLISEARGKVAEGRDAAALESFRSHARQFPRGALAEERAAWIAILQCRLGRDAGSRAAAAFLEKHPDSPHVARVRTTCSTSVTDRGSGEE